MTFWRCWKPEGKSKALQGVGDPCCPPVPALGALPWASSQESEPRVPRPRCHQELASPDPGVGVLWVFGQKPALGLTPGVMGGGPGGGQARAAPAHALAAIASAPRGWQGSCRQQPSSSSLALLRTESSGAGTRGSKLVVRATGDSGVSVISAAFPFILFFFFPCFCIIGDF